MTDLDITQISRTSRLPSFFQGLTSIAAAIFTRDGTIIDVNQGFRYLCTKANAPSDNASDIFLSPTLLHLTQIPEVNRIVYQGILTLGCSSSPARSIKGTVYRYQDIMLLLGEFDVEELEQLSESVISLNSELAEKQRSLVRVSQALQKSEQRYRSLIERHTNAVCTADLTGQIVSVNQSAERLSGFGEDELVGKSLPSLFAPSGADELEACFALARNGEPQELELLGSRKDGTSFEATVTLVPIVVDGRITGMYSIIKDVSERRRMESEIRRLNEQLEARVAERTAMLEATYRELANFSYAVSHHLRAPLRAVSGYAHFLDEDFGAGLPDGAKRYLELIHQNTLRMGKLIDDLVSFTQLNRQALRIQKLDITQIVHDIVAQLSGEYRDVSAEFRIDRLPTCYADRTLLTEVFAHLLTNAVKFSRMRSPAIIEVGYDSEHEAYYVKDNGMGFDMAYAERMFGVFERLNLAEEFEGVGAGLAIVSRIVARHGGRVWANGAFDHGATFYLALPNVMPDRLEESVAGEWPRAALTSTNDYASPLPQSLPHASQFRRQLSSTRRDSSYLVEGDDAATDERDADT